VTDTARERDAGRSLFTYIARQRLFIYLATALVTAAGIWAAFTLPSAIYPELVFSRVTVVAEGTALGARQVLFSVTRPIEEAVSVVPGVVRVDSKAIRGGSETNINFSPSTDMVFALQQVQARVNQIRGDLPPGLDIEVERMTPSLFPILTYNLQGGDPAQLYDIARYQIRPLISRVPGVGRVDVQGAAVREVEVIADPTRLAQQQLTFGDFADAIKAATEVAAVGRMPENYKQYLIVTSNEPHAVSDIADIVVSRGLRVRDLATVTMGTEDRVSIVAGDGKPAALINVTRQVGGNTLAVADSIAAIAASVRRTLPPGVVLKPVYDQASLVRDAVRSVRDAMLVGAVLAVIVLLVFLRHGRITAISASSIPITMCITVFVMSLIGQTFNLMTLGAMAIAIGIVIDDAVVITENIVRHMAIQPSRSIAVREAVQELIWPVTSSTITTVVVFLPLGLLTGVEGQFFHALSITLTIAVLVSLLVALTIIPLLSEQYLRAEDADSERPDAAPGRGPLARFGRAIDSLSDAYQRALGALLRRSRVILPMIVALGLLTWLGQRLVETGFLPVMDEGAFVLDYWTPGGTALDETNRMIGIAERILMATPEVMGTSRRTGAEMGLFATEQNTGDIAVRLKPEGDRDRSVVEVMDDVRGQVEHAAPRMRVEFIQILSDVLGDLAGATSPVEIKLFGPDLGQLEAYGKVLGEKLEKIDGLEDVYNGVSEPGAELTMSISAAEANRAGLAVNEVSDAVSTALLGEIATEIRLEDRSIGVRVRAPDSVRFNPTLLGSLPIVSTTSRAIVPLSTLASFKPVETRAELYRENQQQMIAVTAELGERSLGPVMGDVKQILAETRPPAGVRVELGGQYAGQQSAFRALLLVLALAAASVVCVMLIQFQSLVEPLVILLAAPLSFVGGLALLILTNTPLNVASFMGLILLVGLIVKNGIILLDFTRHRMTEGGLMLEPALLEAARVRLRPILMTTLCTLFGLFPLALGLGAGSDMQRPLALAVIGGLALSTPITLFLVPMLLVVIRGREYRVTHSMSSRA
jgi:CzcA family heavy metal efflux pump